MNGGVPRREWYEASLGARKQGGILLPTTDAKYSAAFEMSRKLLGLYENAKRSRYRAGCAKEFRW